MQDCGNSSAISSLSTSPRLLEVLLPPWASYQIRKIAGCACAGNAGNVFPRRRFQRKPLVSDSDMHHGTCMTHVPWCMAGSLTCGDGENVPGIPGACAPTILRIWQEAHGVYTHLQYLLCLFWFVTLEQRDHEVCQHLHLPEHPSRQVHHCHTKIQRNNT